MVPLLIAAGPKHPKKSLKELKKQHAVKGAHLHDLKVKAHHIHAAAAHVRGDIYSLDDKIIEHVMRINKIHARLAFNKKRAVILEKELQKAIVAFNVRSDQAKARIREMFMHGDSTLASALVGSSSLGDLSSREFIVSRIAERDRELFEGVKESKLAVTRKKSECDALIVQNKKDEEEEKTAKAELEDERQDKADNLQELKAQESDVEQQIRQDDADMARMESDIQSYEAGPGRSMGAFHGRFMPPCFGARLASPFGMRFHPILHRMRMHTGQDFACAYGTPIHCAADGIVVTTRYMHGYGNAIVVDHGGGYATLYGHCSRIISSPGQRVRRGETIALVGATGLATGPHCHFEIRVNGRPVNPMPYLRG
ncbi:MAG TPA: peptidoglycan DD-metalloendopeptidase family protein [Fimbriimonadaceae bacterium]